MGIEPTDKPAIPATLRVKLELVKAEIAHRRWQTHYWLAERAEKIGWWIADLDYLHDGSAHHTKHLKFLYKSASIIIGGTALFSLYGAFFETLLTASVAGMHYGSRFLPRARRWHQNRREQKKTAQTKPEISLGKPPGVD